MKQAKAKIPSLVSILVLTLITTLMWISFDVYRAFTVKPAPNVPKEILEPLDPNFDTKIIDQVEGEIFLSESEIPESNFAPLLTPASEEATTSGELGPEGGLEQ